MTIVVLDGIFSVCKVADYFSIDLTGRYCFTGRTDEENSLVCETEYVPTNVLARDDGWRCFRVAGTLDFSLVGVLAQITKLLADAQIGIFAVSTYNTDYIFVKKDNFARSL